MADRAPIRTEAIRRLDQPQDDAFPLIGAAGIDPAALRAFARQNARRLVRYFPATLEAAGTPGAARAYVRWHAARARQGTGFLFALPASDGRAIAGLLFITSIEPDAGVGEVAAVVGGRWEGTGMMQAAMRSTFAWCRRELGLRRVRFLIAPGNRRSLALARALGFRREPRAGRRFRAGTRWEEILDYHSRALE